MARTIEARVRQKKDTLEGWMNNPLILLDGEQAFVLNANGREINYKLGDGTKRFSELEFMIQYDQAAYVAAVGNILPIPQNEVGYSILNPGTYNGNLVVPAGNLGIASYAGSNWYLSSLIYTKGEKGDRGEPGLKGDQGIRGAKGDKGDGIDISGSVNTYQDLSNISPTPNIGDSWVVNSDGLLYVYGENGFPIEGDGIQFIIKKVYASADMFLRSCILSFSIKSLPDSFINNCESETIYVWYSPPPTFR